MKILFATDGSEHAEDAARFLAQLPPQESIELTVISVIPAPKAHNAEALSEWHRFSDDSNKRQAMSACATIAKLLGRISAQLEIITSEGHIGTAIIDEARFRGAELIVLGAVGHSALERLVLGSVSDFVTLHAPCSVLLVRSKPSREKENKAVKICLACDASEPFHHAIEQLKRFKWKVDTELDVINVVTRPYIYPDIPADVDIAAITSAVSKRLETMCAPLAPITPNINRYVAEAEHVGSQLVEFCRSKGSDIIVLEDRGRGMLERFLLGSVLRYVVRHADCSVWIARKGMGVLDGETLAQVTVS